MIAIDPRDDGPAIEQKGPDSFQIVLPASEQERPSYKLVERSSESKIDYFRGKYESANRRANELADKCGVLESEVREMALKLTRLERSRK